MPHYLDAQQYVFKLHYSRSSVIVGLVIRKWTSRWKVFIRREINVVIEVRCTFMSFSVSPQELQRGFAPGEPHSTMINFVRREPPAVIVLFSQMTTLGSEVTTVLYAVMNVCCAFTEICASPRVAPTATRGVTQSWALTMQI